MKKFLLLLFLPFLLGASANQDTGWFTRSNCLTLGNPQAFGTVCLNTAVGTLSQGHQYTFQGGSPGSAGSWLDTTGGGTGGGSVNIFSSGNLSPLFTTSVATPTTTPALSFVLSNAAANTIFGNATSGSAAPSFGQLVTGQITNSAVTLAKIQNAVSSSKLIGSGATGSGTAYSEITLGTGLSMSGTTLNSTGGGVTQLTGPVTAGPGSGVLATAISNSAVTLANIANATANSVLLGAGTTGSGSPYTQISLGTGLSMSGTTLNVSTGSGNVTGTGTTGTIPVFTGISSIGNSIMTQPDVNTIALGSGNTGTFDLGKITVNGSSSGTITIQPQAAAGTFNFNLPITSGSNGDCMKSGGGGASPMTWGSCGGSAGFDAITSGTNTTAAMLVGAGATLGYTSTGTIDATTVNGSVVAPVKTAQTTDPSGSNNTAGGYPDGSEWINTTASPTRTWLKISESGGVAVWRNFASARTCEITWGTKSAGASAIATDDDVTTVCVNQTGATQTVLSVECTANNTITYDVTAGNGGSTILTGAVTCGTSGSFNAATLSGTPTIADGATLDINVNTNAGSATYAVVRIKKL